MNAKKILAMILAVVLLMTATIAGTIAWLTDETQEIQNTFSVGNIDIELDESNADEGDEEGVEVNDSFKIIPGTSETKDPTVTVKANSEPCWVYIEVVKNGTVDTYVTYSIDSEWTALGDAYPNVYYIDYAATSGVDVPYPILTGNTVSYSQNLTKEEIDLLYTKDDDGKMIPNEKVLPQLSFKAYAIQKVNGNNEDGTYTYFTAEEGWLALQSSADA